MVRVSSSTERTKISDSVSERVRLALRKAASRSWSWFTLAELIVVVAILAVLAAIGFLALSGYSDDARDAAAKSNVRSVLSAIRSESAVTWNSPRRYIVHDASLSGIALSWAFVEYSGKQLYLTGGNWNVPDTNYSAGNPDWSALKLDPSKFKIAFVPNFPSVSQAQAYDPKSVLLWAADSVERSWTRIRSTSVLQGAAILPSGSAYVTGDAPSFSSSTGASLSLIRDPAQSSSTWALIDSASVTIQSVPQIPVSTYSVWNSVRIEASRNGYFSKTPPTGGNLTAWTMSFWTKRGKLGVLQDIFWALSAAGATTEFWFNSSDQLFLAWNSYNTYTSATSFRDPSAFYHIVVTWDTNNATSTDRARIYVNGKRIPVTLAGSHPSAGLASYWNSSALSNMIGRFWSINYDGYLSGLDFIDGQALGADAFWESDPASGSWRPKQYVGAYGTGWYRLDFSSWATVAALGTDSSWNGNSFTVSAWVALADWLIDSPSNVFPTLNPLDWRPSAPTFGSANLKVTANASAHQSTRATQAFPRTGKWYWEAVADTAASAYSVHSLWIATTDSNSSWPIKSSIAYLNNYGQPANQNSLILSNGATVNVQTVWAAYSQVSGDVLRFAYDADTGKYWIWVNSNWFGASGAFNGDPATWTNPVDTLSGDYSWIAQTSPYWAQSETFNFWQGGVLWAVFDQNSWGSFKYSAPSGFKALSTANLPAPAIANPSQFFDVVTYTGNGSSQNVGGLSFRPDLVWWKARNAVDANWLIDAVRWPNKILKSDSTIGESTAATLTSFNSDGFSVDVNVNQSWRSFVAWSWKEWAMPGFDIVTYAWNGSNARQIAHSLGSKPAMYFTKNLDGYNSAQGYNDWSVYHKSINQSGASNTNWPWCAWLHSTSAPASGAGGFDGVPNSSVFFPNQTAYDNVSWKNYVAYLWSEVPGFSKFGTYVGNWAGSAANNDWPFVNLWFRPALVMIKRIDVAWGWFLFDNERNPTNSVNGYLLAQSTNAEWIGTAGQDYLNFVSNGWKILSDAPDLNASGWTYLYAAFAESPFGGFWIAPATAK